MKTVKKIEIISIKITIKSTIKKIKIISPIIIKSNSKKQFF